MTADELDREYARQLTAMAAARVEHENPRHLRLMARETRRRRGAEMPAPEPGAEIRIWADLHFDEERIWRAAERPWPAVEPMNAALRRSWRESMAPGATMVCAGDIGGHRTILGRWHRPCAELPGPWRAVLGNHDFTWILGREKALGAGTASMTLVIRSDPPLLVTHVPLTEVPDGCVNVPRPRARLQAAEAGSVDQRQRRADALPPARRAGADHPPGEGSRRPPDTAGAHDGRTGAARAPRGSLIGTV